MEVQMHAIMKWAALCGVALAFSLAAAAGASAFSIPGIPLKADAVPRVIEVRKGGGMSGGGPVIRRMGGGGRHAISQGGRMPRVHSGGRGGYRAINSGGRGSYRAINSGRHAKYRAGNRGRDYAVRNGKIRRNAYYNQYQDQVGNRHARRIRNADGRHYGSGQPKRHSHYDPKHHGHRYKHKHDKYRYYHDGWWYGWPWWTGIGIGIGIGWGDYWDEPVYGAYGAHEEWCLRRYRSYDPATDTYLGYDGRYHRCISPYVY
jgi:hypothetical protein